VRRFPGDVGISLGAGETEDNEDWQGPSAACRESWIISRRPYF
jgi:hypothetical protein